MQFRYILTTLAILILAACAVAPVMAETGNAADNATSYYNIAEISISTGDYQKAVQYFDKALSENTTLIASGDALMYTYKDKTAALTDLGRYDEAITTANAGIVLFPNSSGLWNNKGYALYKAGRNTEAVDAFSRAVTIEPDYVKGWINKGNALAAAGRSQDAIEAFNKALTLDAGNNDAATGLAAAQKSAGSSLPVTTIAIIIVVIAAAGGAVWYFIFRKSATEAPKEQKKSKNNK
jgi:tetratricopeptide (TPR) repeat protein